MLSTAELRQLVPAAKQGDEPAMERLCVAFRPLVYSICRRQSLCNVLHEDAENTVWVLFLEAVAIFDDALSDSFPSFARKHIIRRILNIFKHNSYRFQFEQLSSMEDGTEASMVKAPDHVQSLVNDLALKQELGKLSTQQSYVLQQYYCRNKPLEAIATTLKISPRTVRYHRQKALKSLSKSI